jgi:PAS domain S-box-containing protein
MNALAKFVVEHPWLSRLIVLLLVLFSGWTASEVVREQRQDERLSLLQTEAERRGIEIMSQTLNGNVMGALGLLGTIDPELKREARGEVQGKHKNDRSVEARGKSVMVSTVNLDNLESIGRSYDAEGAFVVKSDGMIGAGWDNAGKPSTGLNVKFRPYFQMAMQGMENVYAAVSQARGDRMLYFSAPVYAETTSGTEAIGAVVARTGMMKIDNLLRDKADIALLLSPQALVFASSRPDWIGLSAGTPTPERLRAIKEIKQFGDMFVNRDPSPLPLSIEAGVQAYDQKLFAVASAKVQWNDPLGDWTLVLMEDLARTVPMAERMKVAGGVGFIVLLLGALLLRILRGHHEQVVSGQALSRLAEEQRKSAERKALVAGMSLRLQQTKTVDQLIQIFLVELHGLVGMLQGVMYVVRDKEGELSRAGSYACSTPLPETLAFGEGLLGQCAVERRLQVITTGVDRFAMIRSGLGETAPTAVLMAPVMLNYALLGVIEAAVLKIPDDDDCTYFEELVALLAVNLEIVGRTAQTEQVLSVTLAAERAQAEQLGFQQALVDTIPYPVFYKGADTRFLGFNRAYEETFGVNRADLIGKRVMDLEYLPEADRIAYQAEDEAVIASAGSVRRDMQMPFADGAIHDTLYFVSGFRRVDGLPGGLVGTFIDITALKNAEREMVRLADMERFNRLAQGREHRVLELKREINALAESVGKPAPYATSLVEPVGDHELQPHPDYRLEVKVGSEGLSLADLVDLDELQKLFTAFCDAVGVPAAIIDLNANVLASSRWQRACTDFHRVNPDSCARCIESDTELALKLQDGQDFTMYRCKNGMTDCASPIVVEGHHLANVFIGQFHLGPPDEVFFRQQAQQFGYDEADYLRAIAEAPTMDEKRLPAILGFLTGFAHMVSSMSLARRRADAAQQTLQRQAELLQRERVAALSLAEDAEQSRIALEAIAKESKA